MLAQKLRKGFALLLSAGLIAASAVTTFAAPGDDAWGEPPEGFTFEAFSTGETVYATPKTNSDTGGAEAAGNSGSTIAEQIDLDAYATEMLNLVNQERKAMGLSALQADTDLIAAAKTRAAELETIYSHTRPNDTQWYTIFDDTAIDLKPVGENISWGQKDARGAISSWMASTNGHREMILNADAEYLGMAVHQKENGNLTFVLLFAKD